MVDACFYPMFIVAPREKRLSAEKLAFRAFKQVEKPAIAGFVGLALELYLVSVVERVVSPPASSRAVTSTLVPPSAIGME